MSLTLELDRRGTPVREWFETRFPAKRFKALSKSWYLAVRAAPLLCEPPATVNPGTLGTAFDYRARLCWAPLEWETTVAADGALYTLGLGQTDLRLLAVELRDELTRLCPSPAQDDLSDAIEERVSRCCYALALYEQFFRTLAAAASSPLLDLTAGATIEELLFLAPQAAVSDLSSMTRVLCSHHSELFGQPTVLNPRFDGSVEIGGADADLVVGQTLIEIKTTKQDSFERVDHLYQLLGYALLDYSHDYELKAVAVYLARRGLLLRWAIEDVLDTCSTSSDWEELQLEFRNAVAQSRS